jgi:hypothetical protein
LVEFVDDPDLTVKRMVEFSRREVPRRGFELPPEPFLRVGPNNV